MNECCYQAGIDLVFFLYFFTLATRTNGELNGVVVPRTFCFVDESLIRNLTFRIVDVDNDENSSNVCCVLH